MPFGHPLFDDLRKAKKKETHSFMYNRKERGILKSRSIRCYAVREFTNFKIYSIAGSYLI